MDKFADLHLHTTASDGEYSPQFVVKAAKAQGFAAIAITDHDTVSGLQDALDEGRRKEIEVLPGVEISTVFEQKEIHILGYLFDPCDLNLMQRLDEMRNFRQVRIEKMVARLNELGIEIALKQVRAVSGSGVIGRPHVAKILLEQGYVRSIKEAFAKLLSPGCPAYIPRYKINPAEAIHLLLAAGGIPVLAHPGLNPDDELIADLKDIGLQGIEVWHPEHNSQDVVKYLQMAQRYDLLPTGGSDWHGGNKDSCFSLGSIKLAYSFVEKIKERKEELVFNAGG
ncbi:MAG: PHP domain-containing protein [Peptococcaceae bacterium]